MFGWLFGKNEKDHGYIKPEGFASGPHIPQPQPERRTRNPVAMPEPARMGGDSNVPKQKAVQPDISEPVITLLKMLERDEWEFLSYNDDKTNAAVTFKNYYATNIFKESVVISVDIVEYGPRSSYGCTKKFKILAKEWMTEDEMTAVGEAVIKRFSTTKELNLIAKRECFAQLINVEV